MDLKQTKRGDQMMKVLRGAIIVLGAAAILAVSAVSAFAGQQYGGGGVAGESTGGGGTLPFTGADLALYALVGLAIIASGLALRPYAARRRIG
jgi:hypothetical protein